MYGIIRYMAIVLVWNFIEPGSTLESRNFDYQQPYNQAVGSSYSYSPVKINPVEYGLVRLPDVYPTRAPPNPAATEWPYAGGVNSVSNTTVSPTACKSTTYRTNLNCPCKLIGLPCFPANSKCIQVPTGDGICGCVSGYVAFNFTCVTSAFFNQNVSQNFTLLTPHLSASCFLPTNAVVGNVAQVGANGSVTFTMTLLSTLPSTAVTTSYITVESSTGNLLFVSAPPIANVTNQTYSVFATDSTGITSNVLNFTILYNCAAPVVSFDLGNNFIVDCTRDSVGDVLVTALATGTVAPTTFSMTLVSSTSTLSNTYYAIDPNTGQIFLQNEPHGGIFIEVYSVTATNAVGQTSAAQTVTFTTTATCT